MDLKGYIQQPVDKPYCAQAVERKEKSVAVKVIIDRVVKEEHREEAIELIRRLRSQAMMQRGYISGETLVSQRNPNHVVVVSTWNNLGNWLDWTDNESRNALERELAPLLASPASFEEFALGAV